MQLIVATGYQIMTKQVTVNAKHPVPRGTVSRHPFRAIPPERYAIVSSLIFLRLGLFIKEKIPWKCNQLAIGTGAYGRLPVMKEVRLDAIREILLWLDSD